MKQLQKSHQFIGHGAIVANQYAKFPKLAGAQQTHTSHAMALKCQLPCALVISHGFDPARPTCGAVNRTIPDLAGWGAPSPDDSKCPKQDYFL